MPLARALDSFGRVFDGLLKQNNIDWGARDDAGRRELALAVMRQVPLLWVWDNVEPVAGFPTGSASAWSADEQRELREFLVAARETQARMLITSRREETGWLGELPRRIAVPPMPLQERAQLAQAVARRLGRSLGEVEDWMPLLRFSQGNPMTVSVLVRQALRDGIRTAWQVEQYVSKLLAGAASLADDAAEGRTRSLGASLSYGFDHAFTPEERRVLALLHLFQGFVNVNALVLMGDEETGALRFLREYGLDRAKGIALLDRAAEVGLLETVGDGYYRIHPALPWYFRDMFDAAFPPPHASNGPSALRMQRAYAEALGGLGNYYWWKYEEGNRQVISALAAEEDNLLHARRLARANSWWDAVIGCMQGLRNLYGQTGRRVEWARLVQELVPDFCGPDDEPLPGRGEDWILVIGYRVHLARQDRDWAGAESLQRRLIEINRLKARAALAKPPAALDSLERHRIRTLAVTLENLGNIELERGEASCVGAYEEALQLAELIGDQAEMAICANNLGIAYETLEALRDFEKAEQWYTRSLELHVESDGIGRGRGERNLGDIASQRFDEAQKQSAPNEQLIELLNKALSHYFAALKLIPTNAVNTLAITHNQIGLAYLRAGDLERALEHYDDSIRLQKGANNHYGAGQAQFNVALALYKAQRLVRARLYAKAALNSFAPYGAGASADVEKAQRLIAEIDEALVKPPS